MSVYFWEKKKCIFKNYSVQEQNDSEVYIRKQIPNEKDSKLKRWRN